MIFTDYAGQESPSLTFAARTHARRPLYTRAAGKILLANVPDDELHRLLDDAGPEHAGDVRQFLTELPEIRSRRLAFNRGVTIADAYVVATPLLARDGRLIAAISAAIDSSEAPCLSDRLDDLGEELKKAVAALGSQHGLTGGVESGVSR
jgi:IclR family acetate operon transcriptional repressor